jgi:hypothetical protein
MRRKLVYETTAQVSRKAAAVATSGDTHWQRVRASPPALLGQAWSAPRVAPGLPAVQRGQGRPTPMPIDTLDVSRTIAYGGRPMVIGYGDTGARTFAEGNRVKALWRH